MSTDVYQHVGASSPIHEKKNALFGGTLKEEDHEIVYVDDGFPGGPRQEILELTPYNSKACVVTCAGNFCQMAASATMRRGFELALRYGEILVGLGIAHSSAAV